jgi:DUF177 domain-containing protein
MAVIDSLEFAKTGQILNGSLPLVEMPRLKDGLIDAGGAVEFEIRGGRDSRRRPVLMLKISGTLRLQCQRCLEAMDYPLEIVNKLRLVENGADDETEVEIDWIEASPALDVAALVEDELVLSLPYSPRHEEGQCQARDRDPRTGDGASAFGKLAALKQNGI